MRLIDADALSKLVGEPIEVFLRRLDLKLPPTVDAVEVVRCKDCMNCSECIAKSHDGMYSYIRCLWNGATICENDYCSWGEKR